MKLNEIPYENGCIETMIERLFKTMNAIDKRWSEKVEPATQKQIQDLIKISGLQQQGKNIPLAYLLFLRAMGQNDNGLLEQEWDGFTEVNIDRILEDYLDYADNPILSANKYILFSIHWTESALCLKLTDSENPPVYYWNEKLFSNSFENYLFHMAFCKMESTQILYHIHCSLSPNKLRDCLFHLSNQGIQLANSTELVEYILRPYQLHKMWFSDDVHLHFYNSLSEYTISIDLYHGIYIMISSNNRIMLQKLKETLTHILDTEVIDC